jgi:hypothetical protein
MSTRVAVALTAVLLVIGTCVPAWADFSGIRINFRGLDLQFMLSEEGAPPKIAELLFGESALVSRLGSVAAAQAPESARRSRDLTVEIEADGEEFIARFSSTAITNIESRYPEGELRTSSWQDILTAICVLAELSPCDTSATVTRPARMVGRGAVESSVADANHDVVITIGSLPSDDPAQQIVIPDVVEGLAPRGRSLGNEFPLDQAIRGRAGEAFPEDQMLLPGEGLDERTARAASRRIFAVHCTAFGANDDAMRRWVRRNIQEGRRNKSHGVILPSGEWLPMWPFEEARVWATKTETCAQTKPRALGAVINIELHYFCAVNRPDTTSEAQYDRLARLYKEVNDRYGALHIVSHREIDRGLRDGHNDPIGFNFAHFYEKLAALSVDIDDISTFSDARHNLRTGPDISHNWEPELQGPIVLESARPDDCRRDHR